MFIIPSVFTAVDKFSPVVARMGSALTTFEQKLSIAQATSERSFRRNTNFFSKSANSMFDYAKSALAVGATIGGIAFTTKSLVDYEDAVASFRTIVSDLNNTEFARFEEKINSVAKTTRKSTIDVAKAFENIAGLAPEFAKTADAIGDVSAATITLAKASRMELGESASSLVGIMNQFNFEASQSTRVINALAAGQAVGAATISQTALALTKFGATAKGANITLEQSVALVELLGAKGFFAEDAGFKLNSGIVKLQGATLGYKSGVFNLVDALTELKTKYDALGSAAAKDAYLQKVFDITQINTGRILIENIDKFKQTTAAVTGTNEAFKAADINSNTLSNRLTELKNAWITIFTTSNAAGVGVNAFKRSVVFLTNNLSGLVTVGMSIVAVYATWWTINKVIWAIRGAYLAWNFVLGVNAALQGRALMLIGTNTGAIAGYTAATTAAAGATSAWNAALTTTGLRLGIIAGGLALIYSYNDSIQNWANDSRIGMGYNNLIGDKAAVRETLERKYIEDPTSARNFIKNNPKYNTPAIQQAFQNIDLGIGNDDGADAYMNQKLSKIQQLKANQNVNLRETDERKIMHDFKITLEDSNGRTLRVINSSDLVPNVSSTSQ